MDLFHWLKNAWGEGWQSNVRIPAGPRGPLIRRRYRFSGMVQGVGFRYEAMILAGRLSLTGWARNETDGTVTVEAEGETACVREFLRAMQAVPRFAITDIQEENLPPSGTETGFEILY